MKHLINIKASIGLFEALSSAYNVLFEAYGFDEQDPSKWTIDFMRALHSHSENYDLDEELADEYYLTIRQMFIELHQSPTQLIWRTIHLDDISDLDEESLGRSWSYEVGMAIQFARDHLQSPIYIIKATTTSSNIDWQESLLAHYNFGDRDEECELVVINDDVDHVKIEFVKRLTRSLIEELS